MDALVGVHECASETVKPQTNSLCLSNPLLGHEDAVDKGSLSTETVCVSHVCAQWLCDVFVTDTHIPEADRSFQMGQLQLPFPPSSLRVPGGKKQGDGARTQAGSPALPGAGL